MALYGEQLVKNMAALEKTMASRFRRIEVMVVLSAILIVTMIALKGDLSWIKF
jgi:hypothetical protein|tara:strand:- start:1272 stop:1430 length:159 start_codon:yes stop_codon:yes gene_type:complete